MSAAKHPAAKISNECLPIHNWHVLVDVDFHDTLASLVQSGPFRTPLTRW
jgi:hypothetical protein